MARITVEDCLDHVDNRFELVMLATRRARSLRGYGNDPLVPEENDKPTVIALREIAEGLISHEMLDSQEATNDDEEIELNFSLDASLREELGNGPGSIEGGLGSRQSGGPADRFGGHPLGGNRLGDDEPN